MGSYKKPTICDDKNILAVSKVVQKVEILCGDYEATLKEATVNSFFYFDPPYKPLSNTSSFNSYAKDELKDEEQVRLEKFCSKLDLHGHQWILSNSDVKGKNLDDNSFDDLYSKYTIQRVDARRSINANSEKYFLGVPFGRAFRSNLLFVTHKRIFTTIPNAKLVA
jgi:DNA adenine methylase